MTRTPVRSSLALSSPRSRRRPAARSRRRGAERHPTLAIGAKAPDFDLPGVDGKRYTLASFAGAKVLVFVFTANHCPTAQAYEERIEKLHADFAGRGVQFVLVSPNDPLALRLDEQGYSDLGRLPGGHEDPGEGPRVDVPLPLRRRDGGDVAAVRAGGDPARLRLRRRAEAALRRPRGRRREPGEGHDQRRPQRHRGGPRREARARRDHQGLRLLGEVVGQAAVGEGGLREVGAGAGHPRDDRRGRDQGARAQRGREEAPPPQRLGDVVRAVRDRVPRHRLPQPHLPRARVRGGDGERRRAEQAREGARVPEDAAGLDPQRRLRQGRPLRAHRGGGPEVAGRPAAHDRGGARGAR